MDTLKKILIRYFSSLAYFYKYLRYRIFIVVALSIIIGLLDGIGLAMFIPLLQLSSGETSASADGLGNLKFIVIFINSLGFELNLQLVLLLLIIFFSLKGITVYTASAFKVKINQYYISTLRITLTDLLTRFSYKVFVKSDVGRIQNSLTGEITRVTTAYSNYNNCMQQSVMVLVYLSFVFLIDMQFALLVCIGGLLTNQLYRNIYTKTKKQSVLISKNNSKFQGLIIQFIANFKYLKATGYVIRYAEKLKTQIKVIEENNKKIGLLNSIVIASREPMLIGVVCLVILIQAFIFKGSISSVLLSIILFYRALLALIALQTSYNNFLAVSGSLDNIQDFEKELKHGKERNGKYKFDKLSSSIVLDNVSFGYYDNDLILKDISLTINKNETIAFVGESGSGKTTLVNLICGLLPVNNGKILIDNKGIDELDKYSYQLRIGYISQEPVIFNDTIFNNISFWSESNKQNIERFNYSIKQSSIYDFVNQLKNQDLTLLGNNGINISGGQKQRISISREIFKDVDILLFDEATSSLDSETERAIHNNIEKFKGKYTILIIAHRLSTIKNADKIFLMDKGRIINYGKFDELNKSSEKFRKMVVLQEV